MRTLPVRHRFAAALALLGGATAAGPAWAAGCAEMRGGELVLRASDTCLAQIRRDPGLRRHVVRTIDVQMDARAAAPSGSGGSARSDRRGAGQGLSHPLARLSMLNAQSRYLWSLGNPAPSYYGQTATP